MNTYLDKPVSGRGEGRGAFFFLSTYSTSWKTTLDLNLDSRCKSSTYRCSRGKSISLPKTVLITVQIDICLDFWLRLVTKGTNKYTHPIKKHLVAFWYCRETSINPKKPVSKSNALTVQMLSQEAPLSYTVSYIAETQVA